ncbi:DUF1329 domain-containing protein [Colwellia sp. Arc7-D]|jgi:hypothetical protein|uniref:DUF1329 domain-containing protein n=1 Tax=Colwellia sp. Arc7-D TaxID=2161872 RepID=UPI000D3B713E|nr:DUF1329 domain-containing protein [Colwellia sp. Arc7-D]AWB58703.1 DUF1329 domain-containing protein [Colwellia sp. Arc7-D]
MKKYITTASLLMLTIASSSVLAKVSPEEAAKLGTTLTPLGAVMSANAAGTIPAWTGGLNSKNSTKSEDSGRPAHPFSADKPLMVITSANYSDYKNNLSPGQIAMFEKYADYKMPIYKSKRTAAYSDDLYGVIKKNATTAELVQSGNGIINFDTAIPFPIAKNGSEVIWNHITRYRGGTAKRFLTTIPVQSNGSFVPVKMNDQLVWPEFLKEGRDADKDDNILFYYLQEITAPARLTGTALLVHETIDQVKEARKAWVYNAGQRRVRRAPNVAYDGPGAGTDGLRATDNYDMYNGAPDRYDWKLIGKKELYIPYNSYNLLDTNAKYEDLIEEGHLNADYLRYELHRVWQVEATLKEGARHIYAKRTFFIDEDTWGASVIDHYDGRGELWKLSEAHNIQFYDVDTPWMVAETLYDLNSGRYLVTGLSNEEPTFMIFGEKVKRTDFSTSALRRLGR